jgi:hypothetical protein
MRFALAVLPFAVVSCAVAPDVTVHVSAEELAKIKTALRAKTWQPILSIHPMYENHPVPGAIPVKASRSATGKNGKLTFVSYTAYERTDRVSVAVGSDNNATGPSYQVQKSRGEWRIMSETEWGQ